MKIGLLALAAIAMVGVAACGVDASGGPTKGGAKNGGGGSGTSDTSGEQGGSGASNANGTTGSTPGYTATPGDPITAPNEEWTWVDVAGAKCADGSPTGIAVNLTDKSEDFLIFLEGGGACWDGATCWGVVETAFYVATGYDEVAFATDPQRVLYLLNRDDADNPFRDKNIVYVPYCTGDAYAGDNVTTLNYLGIDHETHFGGYKNLGLYLSRIQATFPHAQRGWLAGDSAGGFGAAFNFGRVQDAFAAQGTRIDVIDDSGQPLTPDPGQWAAWQKAWNMQLPADCPACKDGPGAFVDYYRAKYPQSRYGLVSFDYDVVIAPFMGLSLGTFHDELYAMADHVDQSWPNARYIILPGASHVGIALPTGELKTWIKALVNDSPSWASSRP